MVFIGFELIFRFSIHSILFFQIRWVDFLFSIFLSTNLKSINVLISDSRWKLFNFVFGNYLEFSFWYKKAFDLPIYIKSFKWEKQFKKLGRLKKNMCCSGVTRWSFWTVQLEINFSSSWVQNWTKKSTNLRFSG